jgi:23S rRNA (guanosine2251-2'-O)-methyltransferase
MAEGGQARVWGAHAVRALLARRPQDVLELHVTPAGEGLARAAADRGIRVIAAARADLDRRSGGAVHQGVLAVVRPAQPLGEAGLEDLLAGRDAPLVLVLDGVQDPGNLGACLRSADAAGVDAVIIPQRRAAGLGPVARKAASGAAEWVPLVAVGNLASTLRLLGAAGLRRVGADAGAQRALPAAPLTGPLAVVLGGEGRGLRALTRALCDELVAIPLHGAAGSLNVAVAAGICLYEAACQRHGRMPASGAVPA